MTRPGQRSRRPSQAPEPDFASSGPTRWLAGAVLVLLVLIVVGRLRTPGEVAVAPLPDADTGAVIVPPPAPALQAVPAAAPPPTAPLPAAATTPATPTLDLMVRLEARRRIGRAGRLVYLDSLFAESDSMLRRWPERPGDPIRVAMVRDSAYEAATEPDQVVRDAFGRWSGLRLGVEVQFVSDTAAADILVGWIRQFAPEERRTGQTDIEYAADGYVQRGRITLARLDPTGRRLERSGLLITAAHEVGHVLGLGHSDAPGDLMYPSPRSATLSNRDIQTALLIYGLPAGSVKGQ
ncbi:MAG TPA: matrixin family metalloprotease [Gemmatimonadales bacterium]